jgi:hypothetical protein
MMRNFLFYCFVLPFILFVLLGINAFSKEPNDFGYPTGKSIDGEVQFDATLILNSPVTQTKVVLFLRYYVSSQDIAYDLLWAEPAWMSVNFPYPPFDLYGRVNSSQFQLLATPHQKHWDNQLPDSSRGVFSHVLNSYQIEDQRFAFIEYLVTKLTKKDLLNVKENQLVKLRPISAFPKYSARYDFSQDSLKINRTEVYDDSNQSTIVSEKILNYVYKNGSIDQIRAELKEYHAPAGGFTVDVKTKNNQNYKLSRIPALYHKQGRICTVDYLTEKEEFAQPIQLPRNITVKYGEPKSNTILRQARIYNYKKIPKGTVANQKEQLTHFDSDFESLDRKYRDLSNKYWYEQVSAVSQEDMNWLKQFADICKEKFDNEKSDVKKLKYLNRWLLSDMLSGNTNRIIERSLPLYLSILKNNNLEEIEFLGLSQLTELFGIRKEKEILLGLFSSNAIIQILLTTNSISLKDSLEGQSNHQDMALAKLFARLSNDQLKQNHKIEDAFAIRYFIAKTFKNISQSQKQDIQLPSSVTQLMSVMKMKNNDIDIAINEQCKLAQQIYREIATPSQELQKLYETLFNEK